MTSEMLSECCHAPIEIPSMVDSQLKCSECHRGSHAYSSKDRAPNMQQLTPQQKTPIRELIEALEIFEKYIGDDYPTNCSHDQLYVDCDPEKVSEADIIKLDKLGFFVDQELDGFSSYKYGSC